MCADQLWLPKTVLLELEWVLRHCYDLNQEVITETLRKILGLRNLEVEDREAVIQAQLWYSQGMDFGDALHLASSCDADAFVTFDRALAKLAKDLEGGPEIELLSPEKQPDSGSETRDERESSETTQESEDKSSLA